MRLLVLIASMIVSSLSQADLLCGLYRIDVQKQSLIVNGVMYDYVTSLVVDNGDVTHYYSEGNQVRVTQHNRVAYRQVKKTRWSACHPVIYYQEPKG